MATPTPTPIESSPQDERQYFLHHTTTSQIPTLLISDPTTDKSSASASVHIGHQSDPTSLQGLAHFVEHMLFMGSEKYPNENQYSQYLNQHGGSSNAYTDLEQTNYHFDVLPTGFAQALDMFAQFFVEPLFVKDAVERERLAVHSEHEKNVQSDAWRQFQLARSLADPNHAFSKFGTGNLTTLKDVPEKEGLDVREECIKFHSNLYSANLMRLVVYSNHSIAELQTLVDQSFAQVPNQNLAIPQFPGIPYTKEQLAQHVKVVPVKEMRSLDLSWPMPSIRDSYKSKPLRYLSHILGHEGQGSLLALLKRWNYANELSAGESHDTTSWACFSIHIELTEEGVDHVEEIVDLVYGYLSLLKEEGGVQEWIHEETSTVAECQFRFLSKRHPIDYTCTLAENMHVYPPEHVLSGPYKIYEYAPERIIECLSYLTPQNMILTSTSKTYESETNATEQWYQTAYRIDPLSPDCIQRWSSITVDSLQQQYSHKMDSQTNTSDKKLLHLPERNDLIPTDFALKPPPPNFPKDTPKLLPINPASQCHLWYKPDNIFQMPKCNVIALLQTSLVTDSVVGSVLALLWVQLVQEHCNDVTYFAAMAGLQSSFVNARKGIEIHVSGYNHKLHILLQKVIHEIVQLPQTLTHDLFERIKDKVAKQYQNFLFSQPFKHAMYMTDLCLETSKWSIHDKMQALKTLQHQDVLSFSHALLHRFHLQLLVHGNATPEDAQTIADTILEGMKPQLFFAAQVPALRVVQLPQQQQPSSSTVYKMAGYNPSDANSALQVLYQMGPMSLQTNATLALLHHLMQEPAFDELRTQEQLGYIVHTGIKTQGENVKGLMVLIQSDGYDPEYLEERVEAFLGRFRGKVTSMTPEEFQANTAAVVEMFLEKNKNLSEETSKYWDVISNASYQFQKYQRLAEYVKTATVEQVLRMFDAYVAKGGRMRRKFAVHVYGKNHVEKMEKDASEDEKKKEEEGEEMVVVLKEEEYIQFKREQALFPLLKEVDLTSMMLE